MLEIITAAGVAAETKINAPLQLNTPVRISFLETDEHVFSFKPTVSGPYRLNGVKETVAKAEDENGKRLCDNDTHNAEPPLTINPPKQGRGQ
ncbi:MAG: hypothetical protein LBB67_01935 [Oscillospiraceae bacterium]|jgi:hypothetical protein|nr:hypothetical protein [Oscillospiraceae bacterium]